MSLCRTRTAAAAAAAPLSISAVNSVATGKPSFWTRMRQLQEDDIAVAVLVYELTPQGMVVTCDGHRGFIQWRDAVGALKEGRLSGGRVRRGDETLVGQQLLAVVHRLHKESGTLEFKCRPHPGRDVQVGQSVTGVVRFVQSNGAWVDYGDTNDGFLSINHISRESVEALEDHLAVGQELKVFVRSVDREQGRVTLTLLGSAAPSVSAPPSALAPRKRLLLFGPADAATGEGGQEEGTSQGASEAPARAPAREEEARFCADSDFKEGQLVTGVVRTVELYGAFIDYGDTGDGLLHVSQLSQVRVKDMREHLAVGDEIKAILLSRNLDTQRASLSTKWLEREKGAMLRTPRRLFETAQAAAEAEEVHHLIHKRRTDKAPDHVKLAARPSLSPETKEKFGSEFERLLLPDSRFQVGQLVTGTVKSVHSYGAFVDYGDAREGLLHISDVSHATISDLGKVLTVGEELKAILVLRDLNKQRTELSTKWLEREEGAMLRQPRLLYDTAEAAAEAEELGALGSTSQRRMASDERDAQGRLEADSRFQVGQLVTGVVRTIYPFGAFVDYGDTREGLLGTREFSQHAVTHLHKYLAVGEEVKAILQSRVVGAKRAMLSTRWLEREDGAMLRQPRLLHDTAEEAAAAKRLGAPSSTSRRRQVLGQPESEPGPALSPNAEDGDRPGLWRTLQPDSAFQVGQLVTGVVKSVQPYGAFVEYGDGREGLLHISRISREPVTYPGLYLTVGDTLKAILHSRDLDTQRVVLSTKWLEREPGAMLRTPRLLYDTAEEAAAAEQMSAQETARRGQADKSTDVKAPLRTFPELKEGQLVTGVVRSVTAFGAFLDYGDRGNGLLHVSQFSWDAFRDLGDHLAVGDQLKVLLLSRCLVTGRVTLSTKWLERQSGAMLRTPRLLYDTAEEVEQAKQRFEEERRKRKEVARTAVKPRSPPTETAEFWAQIQQLREEGVAVSVSIQQIVPNGLRVTYQGHVGFLCCSPEEAADWAAEGEPLVGQQVSVYISVWSEKPGQITFQRRPPPAVGVKVGQVLAVKVESVKRYGVFVGLSDGAVGLLRTSQFSQVPVDTMKPHLSKGDDIKVLVVSVKGGLTSVSTRHLEREPGGMLRRPRLLWDTEEEAAAELARQQQGTPAGAGQ